MRLEAHKDEAIALKGQEDLRHLLEIPAGAARICFRDSYTNVCQFTLVK